MWQLMSWLEYRRLAVEEAFENGVVTTARRLGVSKSTMYRWIEEQRAIEHRKETTSPCRTTHELPQLSGLMTTTKTTTRSNAQLDTASKLSL